MEGSCEYGIELSGSVETLRSSWVAAQLAAPQEGLSSVSKKLILFAYFHGSS
jgi:hypothetical protein